MRLTPGLRPRRSGPRSMAAVLVALALGAAGASAIPATAHAAPAGPVVLSANTDAAFTALNNAFLVSNGDQRYYKESLNQPAKDYFWRQALDIQAAEDVYDSTGSSATRDLIGRLLDTFLEQNRGGGGLYDWNWNEYNDDLLWAGLAFARGYRITGNRTYLAQAQYAFDRVYDRGWDSALGGGIWWDIRKGEKSALSNSPAVILGALIYESGGGRAYLDKARAVYDWTWSTLLDRSSGAVHENIQANGSLSGGRTVYSAGAFVSAAQAMYRNFAGRSLFDDAKRTTDWVIRDMTSNGIMTNGQREGTWQSEFARGMGEFVRENGLWPQYYDFMKRNADAAWNARRTDLNLTWNRWDTPTPRDDTRAVEAIGSVIMQAVTPASMPGAGGGTGTGVLRGQQSGRCADVPGAGQANGIAIALWDCNGGANQRWTATAARQLQVYGTKCLDASAGGTADGTAVIIWDCNGGANQQWTVNADGTVVGAGSGKCLDATGSANGAALTIWTCNGGTNQRWSRT
ncbi:ricin-type beta-trefoil lectin domain protein [Actinoplanes sp. NPDC000266]